MKILTHEPILTDPEAILRKTKDLWDSTSILFREIWGSHIHHGYYDGQPTHSTLTPQELLLEKFIQALGGIDNQKILDVGCGLGASAIYVATKYPCEIVGINISESQLALAKKSADSFKLPNLNFKIDDAHYLSSFSENTFDIVWSIESCEQYADKARFIQSALRVLKPGGKLLIATWCSDQEYYEGNAAKEYLDLCKIFSIPYMPTIAFYTSLLQTQSHLSLVQDWSDNVKQSWQIGIDKLSHYSLLKLFLKTGFRGLRYIHKVNLIKNAFEHGKIRYGVFITNK